MSPVTCPSCNASLSTQEIRDGWCESCGKKIPSWIQREAPPSARAEVRPGLEERVAFRSLLLRPLASRLARLAAVTLDLVVWFSLFYLGTGLVNVLEGVSEEAREDLGAGVSLLTSGLLALVQVVLLSIRGQTLGKMVLRIRIARVADDSNPGFVGAVLLRIVVPALIGFLPCVGPLFGVADVLYIFADDRRCLHDHIAGTQVIKA